MNGERLRQAAEKIREIAEGATDGGPRWETGPDDMHGPGQAIVYPADSDSAVAFAGADDAAHIAMWHPRVALAVADWLDNEAAFCDDTMRGNTSTAAWVGIGPAFALADLILGGAS